MSTCEVNLELGVAVLSMIKLSQSSIYVIVNMRFNRFFGESFRIPPVSLQADDRSRER